MKAERWKRIEQLYNSALDLEPERREAFLQQACAGDESLRKEVQQLLDRQSEAEDFIESPAIEKLAHSMAANPSSLNGSPSMIGKLVGRYRVDKQIGTGGMGEVYQAKDQKLGRDVAIKVLPKEFAEDSDRVRRFEREAKLLASLNHPNIAVLYELEEHEETQFLVLELVEGETLADRLKRGRISVEESLKFALQIAEALEAAHEKGVIHRDLKPANIKITPAGKVKVLDFGLAKTFLKDQVNLNLSDSPTLSATFTQKGFILGTASYMSPEQAQGQKVDKRTDIWAFGCVLYEMLTGQSAFAGKTVTEILAAVMRAEPEWSSLPENLHERLREVLECCLEKESRDRYHDISDVRLDIQKALADPGGLLVQPGKAEEPRAKWRIMLPWAATIMLTAIIAGFVAWNLREPGPKQIVRFDHSLPEDQHFNNDKAGTLAVSYDGSQIAYVTSTGLFLRLTKEMNARLLVGTSERPRAPFFSPDGQWLGYWSGSDSKLKKIAISGGESITLCDARCENDALGPIWYPDDTIVYGDGLTGIMQVSANGGNPQRLVQGPCASPQFLPDRKSIIYTDITTHPADKIIAQSLESGKRKELLTAGWARYLESGHLIYILKDDLCAVPFNPDTLEKTGEEVPIVENIFHVEGMYKYAISDTGTLAYIPNTADANKPQNYFVWVDRKGKEEPLPIPPNGYTIFNISPDGKRVALAAVGHDLNIDIFIWDIGDKSLRKLIFSTALDGCPLWTLDSQQIVFRSPRQGKDGIYRMNADGTGKAEQLVSVTDRGLYPSSWSSDGNTLILAEQTRSNSFDIGIVPMEGDRKIRPLLNEPYEETSPQISPDGHWLAYSANESGQSQVYVRPFPDVENRGWQISESGGNGVRWSRDGKELFYRNGDSMMAVPVETGGQGFKWESPRLLFRGTYGDFWDIHRDGRFLMHKPVPINTGKINIVLNWFEELKKRVPVE